MATTIIKTIVIKEESTPIKTIVVNRGPRGLSGSLEGYVAVTETITLTSQNAIDKKVILSSPPTNNDVSLLPDGGSLQTVGVDFVVINNKEVSWAGLGLDGYLEEGDVIYITYQMRA